MKLTPKNLTEISAIFFWLMLATFVISCTKKEGCMNVCATNYDATAESDDGSCKGCDDSKAMNYCSGVASDNSCKYLCELNKTGEVYFSNISNTNKTYNVIWDGVNIATIAPGQTSSTFTAAANIAHTLVFRISNTTTNACTPSTPVIPQCQKSGFNCSG